MAWPWAEKSRSQDKSLTNAQGANHMSQKWAVVRTVTGGQLMCQICYEWPTYNPSTRSTKVKNNQVFKGFWPVPSNRIGSFGPKTKANALGSNKRTIQKENEQEICQVTGVQLVCQICYEWPTYNRRTRSTKVKSDQVNYRHCSKVSRKQEPNSTYNSGA